MKKEHEQLDKRSEQSYILNYILDPLLDVDMWEENLGEWYIPYLWTPIVELLFFSLSTKNAKSVKKTSWGWAGQSSAKAGSWQDQNKFSIS